MAGTKVKRSRYQRTSERTIWNKCKHDRQRYRSYKNKALTREEWKCLRKKSNSLDKIKKVAESDAEREVADNDFKKQ